MVPDIVGHDFPPYEFAEWPKWAGSPPRLCYNEHEEMVALGLVEPDPAPEPPAIA